MITDSADSPNTEISAEISICFEHPCDEAIVLLDKYNLQKPHCNLDIGFEIPGK